MALLEVRISNEPALSLYHSLGFERVGLRKKYYQVSMVCYGMVTCKVPLRLQIEVGFAPEDTSALGQKMALALLASAREHLGCSAITAIPAAPAYCFHYTMVHAEWRGCCAYDLADRSWRMWGCQCRVAGRLMRACLSRNCKMLTIEAQLGTRPINNSAHCSKREQLMFASF